MKKNTLGDLNDHLFSSLERLGDEDLKGDALASEITRAQAINAVACQIIANGNLVLRAKVQLADRILEKEGPRMLEGGDSVPP